MSLTDQQHSENWRKNEARLKAAKKLATTVRDFFGHDFMPATRADFVAMDDMRCALAEWDKENR